MAIDEIERTAMVQQLINTLGEQPANTLMKCILPDGAGQVATKDDLRGSEDRLRADFKADMAELTRTLVSQNRTHLLTMIGCMVTIWMTVLVTSAG